MGGGLEEENKFVYKILTNKSKHKDILKIAFILYHIKA
jgi:hypothetical protein